MAGKSESVGGVYKGEHISVSKKIRQNDSCIVGETWELIPNTDFAYVSSVARFAIRNDSDFPYQGAYLCTQEELKSNVNYVANMDNILNEAEGYTNVDYYQKWILELHEKKDKE
jgi:hypothetical protein